MFGVEYQTGSHIEGHERRRNAGALPLYSIGAVRSSRAMAGGRGQISALAGSRTREPQNSSQSMRSSSTRVK